MYFEQSTLGFFPMFDLESGKKWLKVQQFGLGQNLPISVIMLAQCFCKCYFFFFYKVISCVIYICNHIYICFGFKWLCTPSLS